MTATHDDLAARAIRACTIGDAAELQALFTNDVVAWSPVLLATSLDGLVAAMDEVETALSDVEVHIDTIGSFGGSTVAEYRIKGRFTGPFVAGDATVPPNDRTIVVGGAVVMDFSGDRICSFRNYFDELTLLEQMFEPA